MILRLTTFTALILMLFGGVQGSGFRSIDKGPLHITGQTPLQTLRLDVVPARHHILHTNQVELSLFNTWTNRWNKTDEFLIDMEIIQNIFGLAVGVGHDTEVGFSIPIINRTGGYLDRLIMDFHNVLSLGQAGRYESPRNSMQISYRDGNGQWQKIMDNNDRGTVLGDLTVFSKTQFYAGRGALQSLTFTALLRLPTSTDRIYYGTGGTDVAVSVSAHHHLMPFYIYSTLGYGIFGSGSQFDMDMRPYQWTIFAAVELPVNKNLSLIVQELSNSGTSKSYFDFSRPTHELVIGAKQYLSPNLMLEYGLVENLFVFENSNDLGFNFGLTYRL